jgi:release factor glutamine methyltransferase
MQLREALRSGLTSLEEYNVPSPGLAAELLLMHVLGRDRAFLYTYPEFEIAPDVAARYFELIAERATGKPTQYITGHQEFWGLDFEVTPDVLIPRPETEHLVEAVLDLAQRDFGAERAARANGVACRREPGAGNLARPTPQPKEDFTTEITEATEDFSVFSVLSVVKTSSHAGEKLKVSNTVPPRIVDVGTGSGCIALALASELPNAMIVATDLSRPALEVAQRNAERLGLADRVHFIEADLLSCFTRKGGRNTFDFVVSNPPYISRDEIGSIQREVRDFEPRLALGGNGNGGEIYARLFSEASGVLHAGGYVAVEIGYNQSDAVLELLGDGWEDSEVRPDLAGIPRVVLARKQPSAVSYPPSAKRANDQALRGAG